MILLSLGSNLTSAHYGGPEQILRAALGRLEGQGVKVRKLSRLYETEPVPRSNQPWFVNAVARVSTDLDCAALLHLLHDLEHEMGRTRRVRWEARIIDLDLLAYHDMILPSPGAWTAAATARPSALPPVAPEEIQLPHPRLHRRPFVLLPLRDVAPDWRHPVLRRNARDLLANLSAEEAGGIVRPLRSPASSPVSSSGSSSGTFSAGKINPAGGSLAEN